MLFGITQRANTNISVKPILASILISASSLTGGIQIAAADGYKLPRPAISTEFPYQSRYQDVLGSKIHYVEVGEGHPIVFIHGNPTSSYLWRNILPFAEPYGRAIALDLIGMGKSDKPDIGYTFEEHYAYVEAFIDALELEDITLVVHDWGAALGFNYARNHPDNVEAIAFMEGALPPVLPAPSLAEMAEPLGSFFTLLRDPVLGYDFIVKQNGFVEQIIPDSINRPLSEAEMAVYRAPYPDEASRLPVWVWPQEVPIGGEPANVTEIFHQLREFMVNSDMEMLLLYALPGAIVNEQALAWYVENLEYLETNYIGQGLHYVQEDQPEAIGRAVADWLRRLDD